MAIVRHADGRAALIVFADKLDVVWRSGDPPRQDVEA